MYLQLLKKWPVNIFWASGKITLFKWFFFSFLWSFYSQIERNLLIILCLKNLLEISSNCARFWLFRTFLPQIWSTLPMIFWFCCPLIRLYSYFCLKACWVCHLRPHMTSFKNLTRLTWSDLSKYRCIKFWLMMADLKFLNTFSRNLDLVAFLKFFMVWTFFFRLLKAFTLKSSRIYWLTLMKNCLYFLDFETCK